MPAQASLLDWSPGQETRPAPVVAYRAVCRICGNEFDGVRARRGRVRITCSDACWSEQRAQVMARTNREYASERMAARNPMRREDVRARVSAALELGWQTGFAVPTKMARGSGYPTSYKLDVCDPGAKVAVEVDGRSHRAIARREQDAKKDALLAGLGWKVLRVSNEEVIGDVGAVAARARALR